MALQGKQDWIQSFSWLCTDQSSAAELFLAHQNWDGSRNSRESRPLEMSCQGRGCCPVWAPAPSWETGQSQHRAGCESWAGKLHHLNKCSPNYFLCTEICNEPLNNSWTRNHWAVLNETGEIPFHLSAAHSSTALFWMWWVAKNWRISTKFNINVSGHRGKIMDVCLPPPGNAMCVCKVQLAERKLIYHKLQKGIILWHPLSQRFHFKEPSAHINFHKNTTESIISLTAK